MELGEADRAIAAWESLLEAKGPDREALDGLVAILEREARYPDLVHALQRRALLPMATDEVRKDRVRVARIFRTQLANPEAAIDAWRSLEIDLGADRQRRGNPGNSRISSEHRTEANGHARIQKGRRP